MGVDFLKRITIDDKIFSTKEFLADRTMFYMFYKNFSSDSLMLYSDSENYIVCRGKVGLPTWIWTKDNFDISKLSEVESIMKIYLESDVKTRFTCKILFYKMLLKDKFLNINKDDYFEMGNLYCKNTIKPKLCDGSIFKASILDKEILTDYWYKSTIEMNGVNEISLEKAESDVIDLIDNGNFYVWKNKNGKIVSMVNYSTYKDLASINHVYTCVDERGKKYAANLIYNITDMLIKNGFTPMLYTDYNYIPSNTAYKNVGYIDNGILINFTCSKK